MHLTSLPTHSCWLKRAEKSTLRHIHEHDNESYLTKRNSYKRLDPKQCTMSPSLGHKKFAKNTEDTVLKFKFNLCLKIKPNLGLEL